MNEANRTVPARRTPHGHANRRQKTPACPRASNHQYSVRKLADTNTAATGTTAAATPALAIVRSAPPIGLRHLPQRDRPAGRAGRGFVLGAAYWVCRAASSISA